MASTTPPSSPRSSAQSAIAAAESLAAASLRAQPPVTAHSKTWEQVIFTPANDTYVQDALGRISRYKEHRIYCTWLAFVTAFRATGEIPVGAYKLLLNCVTWLFDVRSSKQKGYEIATRDFANLVNCVKTAGGLVVMGVGGFFAPETVFGSLSNMPPTAEDQLKSKLVKNQTNLRVIFQQLCDAKAQLASLRRPNEKKQAPPARAAGSSPSSSAAAAASDDELDDAPEIESRRPAAASASDGEPETPEVAARRLEALVDQLQAAERGLRESISECNTELSQLRREISTKKTVNGRALETLQKQHEDDTRTQQGENSKALAALQKQHEETISTKQGEYSKTFAALQKQHEDATRTQQDEYSKTFAALQKQHEDA
ncbi:MAG TPA: hypothetical protein VMR37_06975, partial [Rhabdochlamydiaceae bacterium]|nr:hypothetical protein [Rhabdochlamydiaceae bacterium]